LGGGAGIFDALAASDFKGLMHPEIGATHRECWAFQFFKLKGFVRRLSEAFEQRITEFDGFGEPSYKLCRLNKTKALTATNSQLTEIPQADRFKRLSPRRKLGM